MSAPEPCWDRGRWVGPPATGRLLCDRLGDLARRWSLSMSYGDGTVEPAEVLVDASALSTDGAPGEGLVAVATGPRPPRRVVVVVSAAWLGRGAAPADSARAAAAVGLARHLALELAPTATTVNAVAVPLAFPGPPPASAPVRRDVGIDDLAHAVRFFGHPDNGYVMGQVVSLCGGDQIWSNHDL